MSSCCNRSLREGGREEGRERERGREGSLKKGIELVIDRYDEESVERDTSVKPTAGGARVELLLNAQANWGESYGPEAQGRAAGSLDCGRDGGSADRVDKRGSKENGVARG